MGGDDAAITGGRPAGARRRARIVCQRAAPASSRAISAPAASARSTQLGTTSRIRSTVRTIGEDGRAAGRAWWTGLGVGFGWVVEVEAGVAGAAGAVGA